MADTRKTTYVVLRDLGGERYAVDGPNQTASGAEAAVRQAAELRAENDLDANGIYIAVPKSSWKPTPITAETRTVVRVGG